MEGSGKTVQCMSTAKDQVTRHNVQPRSLHLRQMCLQVPLYKNNHKTELWSH